jgi:hypothetical protein
MPLSPFYQTALKVHNNIFEKANQDIKRLVAEDTQICNAYYGYVQNTDLEKNPYINKNQLGMIKKLKMKGITTYGSLINEHKTKSNPTLWFEVMQIISSFPREWRKLIDRTKKLHKENINIIPIKENLWKQSDNITLKDIVNRIKNTITTKNMHQYVKEKHKLQEDIESRENPFKALITTTKETKLRNVQFKILHNIYPTMSHLYKWKLKSTPNCAVCNEKETIIHAIYECPIARNALRILEEKLKDNFNIEVNISKIDALIGVEKTLNSTILRSQANLVNTLLIILKRKLILQREDKKEITENEIINMISNQERINNYINKKENRFRDT